MPNAQVTDHRWWAGLLVGAVPMDTTTGRHPVARAFEGHPPGNRDVTLLPLRGLPPLVSRSRSSCSLLGEVRVIPDDAAQAISRFPRRDSAMSLVYKESFQRTPKRVS